MHLPFRVDTSRVNAPAFLRQSPLGRPDLCSLSPPCHRLGHSRSPIHLPSASQRTCTSIAMTGSPVGALWGFLVFYAICLAITWVYYTRRGSLLYDLERGGAAKAAATAPAS